MYIKIPAFLTRFFSKNSKYFPYLLLTFSITSTLIVSGLLLYHFYNSAEETFKDISSDISIHIEKRVHGNEQVLRAATALFIVNETVTRDDWRRYISSFHFDETYPGIQGVGFSKWLSPAEKDANIKAIRAEGFPDYVIRPSGDRPVYTSIIYLEPFNWRNQRAFGYDMYSEPIRRAAMDRAIDSGSVSISAKITLVQETDVNKQSGVLMYSPLFKRGMQTNTVEERRRAIRGFVYSPIRMSDFIYGSFEKLPKDISFKIYAGELPEEKNLTFSSLASEKIVLPKGFTPDFTRQEKIQILGSSFLLTTESLPSFSRYFNIQFSIISLLFGISGSLFLWLYARQLQLYNGTVAADKLRLENLIAGTSAATWEWNVQTGETVFSERWAEIIGYTLAELSPTSYQTWASLTHPDDLKSATELLEFHFKNPVYNYYIDIRMKHKNGQWIWISDRGKVASWSEDGSPLIMQGIHIDITGRKNDEKKIVESLHDTQIAYEVISAQNMTLENVIKGTAAGIWEWDLQTGFMQINARLAEIVGYTVEELEPVTVKTFWNLVHSDDLAIVKEKFKAHFRESSTPFDFEIRLKHKNGGLTWVSNRGSATGFTEDCRAATVHGICLDISERKDTDSLLQQTIDTKEIYEAKLQKLSLAVEQSPVSIVITDAEGIIEYVNDCFSRTSGYTFEEVVGQDPKILQSGESSPEFYTELWSVIKSGGKWEGIFHNKRKDGTLYWENATISALYDEEGMICNYIAVKENISEKKSLTEQLLHSQKVESIGQLAGGLAHDLNNILSVINGYGTLLKIKGKFTENEESYVDAIIDAVKQAGVLSKGMLAYSRKQVLQQATTDLNDLLSKMGEFAGRLIPENINFILTTAKEPLLADIDSGQIEQVIINLITNARDAMPNGGKLSITAELENMITADSAENNFSTIKKRRAVITISDTGVGMNDETMSRIFDPFFTTKEVGKGTGLGLAMVFGIIRQHGGDIDVQSSPGNGTIFIIKLPLIDTDLPAVLAISTADNDNIYNVVNKTGTILVVEDSPEFRHIMDLFLTGAGYEVILAADGNEAVAIFKADINAIDLVISDVVMPNKSGMAARDEIMMLSPTIKFLFMSGHTRDLIKNQGDLGETELLMKPIYLPELLSKVRELI